MAMILHLKKDSVLLDKVNSKRYTWQAGQHSVQEDLAKQLLQTYPELFEEVSGMEGVELTPNPIHTTAPTYKRFNLLELGETDAVVKEVAAAPLPCVK